MYMIILMILLFLCLVLIGENKGKSDPIQNVSLLRRNAAQGVGSSRHLENQCQNNKRWEPSMARERGKESTWSKHKRRGPRLRTTRRERNGEVGGQSHRVTVRGNNPRRLKGGIKQEFPPGNGTRGPIKHGRNGPSIRKIQ